MIDVLMFTILLWTICVVYLIIVWKDDLDG